MIYPTLASKWPVYHNKTSKKINHENNPIIESAFITNAFCLRPV